MPFTPPRSIEDVPTVAELVAKADETVAGLQKVKGRIALLLRRHIVAAVTKSAVRPPNLLVIGPSGGGKTHLLRTMLSLCPVIYAEVNMTEYSDVGYVGRDMTSMYAPLTSTLWGGLKEDGKPTSFAERRDNAQRWGVLLMDEFDKLKMEYNPRQKARKGSGSQVSSERQVGKALQAELLKLVEGTEVDVQLREGKGFSFQTHGVLHIAMGAFEGLPRLMNEIDNEQRNEEYNPTATELYDLHLQVEPYDVERYGFMQELVGRFATIVPFPTLDPAAMARIVTEHVIPEYTRQMAAEGIKFEMEPGAISWLAGEASSKSARLGARAIRPLMETITADAWMQAYPGCTIVATAESVTRKVCELRKPVMA